MVFLKEFFEKVDFEKNQETTKKHPQKQTDRQWPFCRPSWLSFMGQNPYSNWNQSLIVRQTKHIFEIEPEFDGSNPNTKYGRNQVIND